MRQSRYALAVVLLGLLGAAPVGGQLRVAPVAEAPGHVALGLALRRLTEVGSVMMTTAHPDDENNALLAKLRFGEGLRVSLVSATRGDGGQNEIGPELFDALAVLRTEELLAAHRIDGAEQYFTRAVDFGNSFSIEETFDKWGKEEIVGDYVRLVRTLRPDVVIGFIWGGDGSGQHHQASTRLTAEAFRAAADPTRFPEQLKEGLRPWQPKKFYYSAGFRAPLERSPQLLPVDLGVFDPLIGKTWAELGGEARSMHKCQGVAQMLPLPGRSVRGYYLHDVVLPRDALPNRSLLDGVDTRLVAIGRYAPDAAPALQRSLEAIERAGREAQQALARNGPAATLPPLVAGLTALRKLRAELATMVGDDRARYEIDFRLADEARDFEEAVRLASGLRIDLLADDGLLVPGQAVNVSLHVAAHGPRDVEVRQIQLAGLDASAACPPGVTNASTVYTCETEARVPADAQQTRPYWRQLPKAARYAFDPGARFGLPFQPTPFRARMTLAVAGAPLSLDLPIEYRYQGNIFSGEKRSELLVVPALSVRVAPNIAIVPVGPSAEATNGNGGSDAASLSRAVRVDVVNGTKSEARAEIRLEAPEGWRVEPASLPVRLAREDEAVSGRFTVTPPAGVRPGHYELRAVARSDRAEFREGYQVIEYPHIRRRHVYHAAEASLHVLDIAPLGSVRVGYVMGVGDQVPSAIEQLGATVTQLQRDDLARADLDHFDVIVTGVRAYERRDDLRAYNHRLLEWVRRGGTLLVQYNKQEFNQAQYAPWPAEVSSDRVTDEGAPVRILAPDHPVFTTPNRITEATWQGWVQERGLYFLGERDSRYVDLIESEDPFPFNRGPRRGALVEARYGKGRWVYIGLGLWRQLPAGTDGAYALLGNLLALATPR
ncbi:MAG: PIG-L family deacetylase [Vicinamibacteraceae bacterium]